MKKYRFLLMYTLALSPLPVHGISGKKVLYASLFGLGTYAAWRWFQQPTYPVVDVDSAHAATWAPSRLMESSKNLDAVVQGLRDYDQWCDPIPLEIDQGLEGNKKETYVHKGLPQGERRPIFIYSGGWVGGIYSYRTKLKYRGHGAGAYLVHRGIQRSIIHGICVAFDYPTDARNAFNFAQHKDVKCLRAMVTEVRQRNPEAPIVLMGDCKGSATILRYLATGNAAIQNIRGVILESPPDSLRTMAYACADNYAPWVPAGRTLVHGVFKLWFPAHDPALDMSINDAIKNARHIKGIPFFIGHVADDKLSSDEAVNTLVAILRGHGNAVAYCVAQTCRADKIPNSDHIPNPKKYGHGQITNLPGVQQTINAFLRNHALPHDAALAQLGVEHLQKAEYRKKI